MTASRTLPSLLWAALEALDRAYVDEGAGNGEMPPLESWANLLRALDRQGTDVRKLPAILRLSKRAVRSRLSLAGRKGWAEKLESGRGGTKVRLTLLGCKIAARWPSVEDGAELRWRAEIGSGRSGKLRTALEKIVALMPLEHPHYPAGYGAVDASITGGNGQDWKPVHRERGDTVSHLPLSALVSQALVAFAMNYEEESRIALSLSAAVIRRIPPEGCPVPALASSAHIAALHRHGFLRVSGDRGCEIVCLTAKGAAVREAFDDWIRAVERQWRNTFGEQRVAVLRQALQDASSVPPRSITF